MMRPMRRHGLSILMLLATAPAMAQDRSPAKQPSASGANAQPSTAPSRRVQSGDTANAGIGQIGQRQTRAEAAPNVEPLGRIQNRIANRVQNRIRNRIDRNYDPQAGAISPFRVPDE